MTDKLFKTILIIIGGGFLLLLVPVLIYLFILQSYHVRESFDPYYPKGAYAAINKLSYRLTEPRKNDIVVYTSLKGQRVDEIGIIIHMPGETVTLEDTTFVLDENSYLVKTNSSLGPQDIALRSDIVGKIAFCYSGCKK